MTVTTPTSEQRGPPAADSPLAVANLALRFLLELVALGAFGYWAWETQTGSSRLALTVALPLVVAVFWGGFRVPGDGGDPAIRAVSGPLRLALEALVFGGATLALWAAGRPAVAVGFALVVLGHNLLAWRRLRWLLTA